MRKQTPLIAFAAFMLSTGIAHAQFLYWPQDTFRPGHYAPLKQKHQRQTNPKSAKNTRPEAPPKGPLQIIISIADQRVSLFDNGVLIARSSVSTGTRGHPSPLGVFSQSLSAISICGFQLASPTGITTRSTRGPIRWDAHEVSWREFEVQAGAATARVSLVLRAWPCCSRQGAMRAREAANVRSNPSRRAARASR